MKLTDIVSDAFIVDVEYCLRQLSRAVVGFQRQIAD